MSLDDTRTTQMTTLRNTQMKLITPPSPPPPAPIAFYCPGCAAQVLYTRAELDATCATPGQGVTPVTRPCPTCASMMRRLTRPA